MLDSHLSIKKYKKEKELHFNLYNCDQKLRDLTPFPTGQKPEKKS